jgi:hypothetical protein
MHPRRLGRNGILEMRQKFEKSRWLKIRAYLFNYASALTLLSL